MRIVFSKYAVATHIALPIVWLACAGVRAGQIMTYLPLSFLVPFLIEVLLLFPVARKGETLDEARKRCSRAFCLDPLVISSFLLLIYFSIGALNGPRVQVYDEVAEEWLFSPAPISWLPSSHGALEHLEGLFWFCTAFICAAAVRHGLSKRGRKILLYILFALSSGLAIFGLTWYGLGNSLTIGGAVLKTGFFATFNSTAYAAAFFTLFFFASAGYLVRAIIEESPRHERALLCAAMILNLLAASFSLHGLFLVAVWLGGFFFLFHAFGVLINRISLSRCALVFGKVVVLIQALVFLHFVAYTENRIHPLTERVFNGSVFLNAVSPAKTLLRDGAKKVRAMPGNAFWGTGTWGYRHASKHCFTQKEWRVLVPGGFRNPVVCFCDPLQGFVEYGVGGSLLIAIGLLGLFVPLFRRLSILFFPSGPDDLDDANPPLILRFPIEAVGIMYGVFFVAVVSFFEIPFRHPAVFVSWVVLLSVAVEYFKPTDGTMRFALFGQIVEWFRAFRNRTLDQIVDKEMEPDETWGEEIESKEEL